MDENISKINVPLGNSCAQAFRLYAAGKLCFLPLFSPNIAIIVYVG